MKNNGQLKKALKGIGNVFGVMLLETLLHLIIVILVKGFHYSWNGFFTYYENTGTYSIEGLIYDSLSILGLRLVFLEFLFRIAIQFADIRFEGKLLSFLLVSILYIFGFSTLFFGYGFDWSDFFSLSFGWYFHLSLAILSVALIRLLFYRVRLKK